MQRWRSSESAIAGWRLDRAVGAVGGPRSLLQRGAGAGAAGRVPQQEVGVDVAAFADEEGASINLTESSRHREKEPVVAEMAPPAGLEFSYPHRITEVGEEEWERMRGSILGSRLTQTRTMDQFWLPRDEEFLKGSSMLVSTKVSRATWCEGALVEQETFSRMEHIRTSYLKLLGEVTTLRDGRGGRLGMGDGVVGPKSF
ncbi:uncharacterized protein A4U43_C01F18800 [Asparagus officinalis]|uniref:Uncharacterized protein n=1 Tax=Asparagus officinalis TaxID=4686 RepID=A0A5P1FR86_ASPOF|nr:uncharacterized protein A4U43_C01F18800 [Asparagus officinalis]